MAHRDLLADLARIEAALGRLQRQELIGRLRAGVAESKLRATLEPLGLAPNPELVALYGWHDGTEAPDGEPDEDIQIYPGYFMLSSADAAAEIAATAEAPELDKRWFPILSDGDGSSFSVQLGASPHGPIIGVMPGIGQYQILFGSITALFHTIAEAYDRGVYFIDRHGFLEMDDRAFRALVRESNPDIEFWQR